MVQYVKGLAAKLDDLNSGPRIHMVKERADFLSCPLYSAHTLADTQRNVLKQEVK